MTCCRISAFRCEASDESGYPDDLAMKQLVSDHLLESQVRVGMLKKSVRGKIISKELLNAWRSN